MKRIGISAGHYPSKTGARHGDLVEHYLALDWIDVIFDVFDSYYDFDKDNPPYDLLFIPTGTLREKVKYINNNDFDYVIELHFNSASRKASGSETLFMPGSYRGREFADVVQGRIAPALQIRDRGVKEGMLWKTRERTNTPLYFLRRTNCPAVIIEPEFLQSYEETINTDIIIDFAHALIAALDEVVDLNI